MTLKDLRKELFSFLKSNFAGKTFKNVDSNIKIKVTVSSNRKSVFGEAFYNKKAVVLLALDKILEQAVFNNFGQRKEQDGTQILGYLNFKIKILIDGKPEHLRVAIRMQKDGNFYYNIEVNKISS